MYAKRHFGNQSVLGSLLALATAALFGYFLFKSSLSLAAMRIYDVGECRNVWAAGTLAAGQAEGLQDAPSLFLLPLVWLAQHIHNAVDLFAYARLASLGVFWINLLLLTLATGERLLSWRGVIALVGAGTLVTFWNYGFEIRPENLLLTGLLLTWCALRVGRVGLHSYVIAGALAMSLQFTTYQAIFFTLPVSAAFLVFPQCGGKVPRWKLGLAWLGGGLGVLVLMRLAFVFVGSGGMPGVALQSPSPTPALANQVSFWNSLSQLLTEAPLLTTLVLAAFSSLIMGWQRGGHAVFARDGNLPEALLVLLAFAELLINPKPTPAQLVIPTAVAFLLAFRYGASVLKEVWANPVFRPVVIPVFVFAHFAPFFLGIHREVQWTNFRQEKVMQLAESVTDPETEWVYDGVGLVPTRCGRGWNSLQNMPQDQDSVGNSQPTFSTLITTNPAVAIITSHISDRLSEADQAFIRSNYVAVSDEVSVLGKILPPGGGDFAIIHGGRYRISTLDGSDLAGTYPDGFEGVLTPELPGTINGTLDGVQFSNDLVELAPGIHRFRTATNCRVAVVWVGPRNDRLHRQGRGDRRSLFRTEF